MAHVSDFLAPEDLRKISNLQVMARLVVEGFTTGLHRSPHKGFSVEFKQHRQYVAGDEIRHLDWKVYGKSDRFYIREFEEETNLRTTLMLDCSGSMAYGAKSGTKLEYATRLAACIAYLMMQQQDSVGLVTFDSKPRKYIPPRSRTNHLRVLLDEMQRTVPGGETDLGRVIHDLAPKIHRRGFLVLLSDCFGDVASFLQSLARLRHSNHEIIVLHILDRDEVDFPFDQWTRFQSLENASDERLVDPAQLRNAYLAKLEKFRTELTKGCRRHRVDVVPMITDRPYAEALAAYLSSRLRRV